jgi:hypothetical protein
MGRQRPRHAPLEPRHGKPTLKVQARASCHSTSGQIQLSFMSHETSVHFPLCLIVPCVMWQGEPMHPMDRPFPPHGEHPSSSLTTRPFSLTTRPFSLIPRQHTHTYRYTQTIPLLQHNRHTAMFPFARLLTLTPSSPTSTGRPFPPPRMGPRDRFPNGRGGRGFPGRGPPFGPPDNGPPFGPPDFVGGPDHGPFGPRGPMMDGPRGPMMDGPHGPMMMDGPPFPGPGGPRGPMMDGPRGPMMMDNGMGPPPFHGHPMERPFGRPPPFDGFGHNGPQDPRKRPNTYVPPPPLHYPPSPPNPPPPPLCTAPLF